MTFVVRSPPLSRSAAEAVAAALGEAAEPAAGAVSVIEADERQGLWRVDAYYDEEPSPEDLSALIPEAGSLVIERLPDVDWVARSLEGLAPVTAGRFTIHGSHHRHRRPPGGITIEIDAGTAFGTGHHASTLGCLAALDRFLKRRRPRSALDVGSGSGVLAIATALAARARVLALDTDPQAVRVTRANARLNGVHRLVRALAVEEPPSRAYARLGRFELIFANILAGPLVALAPLLVARLAPGGALVLAGLTLDQERQVAGAYRNRGLRLGGRLRIGPWSTLILRRPERKRPAGTGLPGVSGGRRASRAGHQRLSPRHTMWWISLRLRPMSSSSRSSSASS